MKRYKYQALVTLLGRDANGHPAPLPSPSCRMVVRATDHETHATKLFSALVSATGEPVVGDSHVIVTVTLLSDGAGDCLTGGEEFTLWRGTDLGRGVITRRVFV